MNRNTLPTNTCLINPKRARLILIYCYDKINVNIYETSFYNVEVSVIFMVKLLYCSIMDLKP